ncbi:MAG: hypothetical protein ACXAC5_00685 [Promethearchaeota archaeon]|jgi:hypothetical protein
MPTVSTRPAFSRTVTHPAPTADTTLEEAQLIMERMVYDVSMYLEKLEDAGRLTATDITLLKN